MWRRFSSLALLTIGAMSSLVLPVAAQTECDGTSGSATINGAPWSAQCVLAYASVCVDSLGQDYDCFEIAGIDSVGAYDTVALFFSLAPVQGQTYSLGGASGNGALVLGREGGWLTGRPPYTGEVHVSVYDPASSNFECTFSFVAGGLFGPDLTLTNGTFARRVGVEQETWSNVKTLYRDRAH